jgi:hypothetical protein
MDLEKLETRCDVERSEAPRIFVMLGLPPLQDGCSAYIESYPREAILDCSPSATAFGCFL